jgi:crotonobetainyl-CoA:carnitine CoA-transferase CaiB-like acyl-CoA transferase
VIVDRTTRRMRADHLDAHPLLLDGAGGVSAQYPASDTRPVAPAFAATAQLHGALAAAGAAAALVARKRSGAGREVVISGLHAVAAQIAVVTPSGIDTFVKHRARSGFTLPHWRLYRTADRRWVHLATLTEKLFRRVLDAMGRADLMDLPEVGQDFAGFAAEQEGSRAACRELENEFASKPVRHWLDLLSSFDVPCAEVAERPEWAASEIVTRTRSLLSLVHPAAGDVQAVGAPFEVSGCAPLGRRPSILVHRGRAVCRLKQAPCRACCRSCSGRRGHRPGCRGATAAWCQDGGRVVFPRRSFHRRAARRLGPPTW